jgi:hypothetical protein
MTNTAAAPGVTSEAGAHTIVPRAEFRVFGQNVIRDLRPRLWNGTTRLGWARTMPSEIYVLSRRTRASNVKVRDGLLDIKVNVGTTPQGYEIWQPSGKFHFPVAQVQLGTIARHLEVDVPEPLASAAAITFAQFVEMARRHTNLVPVEVAKTRWGFTIDGVMCEYAEVDINGARIETACVESDHYGRMAAVVEMLGLAGRPNVNYVNAASAIVGL